MKERVLVVDGDSVTRQIVVSMLVSADYSYAEASDGAEALAQLDAGEEFELIVTELMMPNLDGIQLLERTRDKYPDIPVVLMTGVDNISVALAAIRNGAYDYLLKTVRSGSAAKRRSQSPRESPNEIGKSGLPNQSGIAGCEAYR